MTRTRHGLRRPARTAAGRCPPITVLLAAAMLGATLAPPISACAAPAPAPAPTAAPAPVPVPAGPHAPPGIAITDAEFVLVPGIAPLGVFTVSNAGPRTQLMTGWSSPDCGRLDFEEAGATAGGVDMLTVPARSRMAFVRGGYHLTCRQPTAAVAIGGSVPVTIAFGGGGTLTQNFGVRAPHHAPQ